MNPEQAALIDAASNLGIGVLSSTDFATMMAPDFSLSTSGDLVNTKKVREGNVSGADDSCGDNGEETTETDLDVFDSQSFRGGAVAFETTDSGSVSLSLPESFNYDSISDADDEGSLGDIGSVDRRSEDGASVMMSQGATRWSPLDVDAAPHGLVAQMQQQISSLVASSRALEQKLSEERLTKAASVAQLESLHQTNERTLQLAAEELKSANERLTAQLTEHKQAFRDLDLSEATFDELSRQPEANLTLREFVCMQVHSQRLGLRGEVEALRLECEEAKELNRLGEEALFQEQREQQRELKAGVHREEGLRLEAEETNRHACDLRVRLEKAEQRCLHLSPKGRDYDDAVNRCAKAEAELVGLRAQVESMAEAAREGAASERAARGKVGDLEHQVSYLDMDKQYLQKEVGKANARADKSEHAAEQCSLRLREVEGSREVLRAQVGKAREVGQSEYEQRLASEMEKQREGMGKELASIRESVKAVHQRECDVLREARDMAVVEAERVRGAHGALSAEHDKRVRAFADTAAAHERRTAELNSEVKMRTFELTSVGVAQEAKAMECRELALTCEGLKEQLSAHEFEFRRLEESSRERERCLSTEVEEQRRCVNMYQELELELDAAVLREAARSEGGGRGGEEGEASAAAVLSMQQGGRGGAERSQGRVRQAVNLSRALLEKERLLEAKGAELRRAVDLAQALQVRAHAAEQKLDAAVDHSSRFVLEELSRSEAAVSKLKAEAERARQHIAHLNAQLADTTKTKEELERDLSELMARQQRVGHLQQRMTAMATSAGNNRGGGGGHPQRQQKAPSPHTLHHRDAASAGRSPAGFVGGGGSGGEGTPSPVFDPTRFHTRSSPHPSH